MTLDEAKRIERATKEAWEKASATDALVAWDPDVHQSIKRDLREIENKTHLAWCLAYQQLMIAIDDIIRTGYERTDQS